ncbi:Uncharacterized protein FKW44_016883 [Caligus rogercresseyi]|uniref:6-phosphogluconate dehydrogenase NADP-binding domain-containing protein n=1 Tax=Caligus rogercresseyi TaxID=217165 RepID=A0A7T8H2D0_CALRO|nr:Uncharacterized protein FKW44_016883 [Caligus rogercresseyi]
MDPGVGSQAYLEFKKTLTSNKKSASFLKAINEMEDFLQGGGKKATGATGGSRQSSGDDAEYEKDAEFDALFKKKTGKTPVGAKGVKRASPLAKPDSAKKARLKANPQGKGHPAFLTQVRFLGLGIMGGGIVKNLLNSGHSVSVWNRTSEKCDEFVKAGALKALTPADVILDSDVTFSCVSDPQAAKDMVLGTAVC